MNVSSWGKLLGRNLPRVVMNGAQVSADGGGDEAEVWRTSPANAAIHPEEFPQPRRSAGDEPTLADARVSEAKQRKKKQKISI